MYTGALRTRGMHGCCLDAIDVVARKVQLHKVLELAQDSNLLVEHRLTAEDKDDTPRKTEATEKGGQIMLQAAPGQVQNNGNRQA